MALFSALAATIVFLALLVNLFLYLVVRKGRENRRQAEIRALKKRLHLPLFRHVLGEEEELPLPSSPQLRPCPSASS